VPTFVSVGSNIEPDVHVPAALERLLARDDLAVVMISPFYVTAPLGDLGGDAEFRNGVFLVETALEPRTLKFEVLRGIEADLGRVDRRGARTIDLDIVAMDDRVIEEPDLVLPDPDWLTRPFIATPLASLDPYFVHPVTGQTAAGIAAEIGDAAMIYDDVLTETLGDRLAEAR
jgi:2-amino-4-hydroxy-6-hydroxymethyldihydropteridine diphosphokinase